LRHVSPAFSEDPVRVLRIARFAARFAYLGFTVADETMDLMRQMSASGETDALVPERVWTECSRALLERQPSIFFQVLRDCGALRSIFPELNALFGVPQRPESHPEVDSGIHTLMVLEQSARLSDELTVRFSALVHDLGKATTQKSCLPSHKGHEKRSAELVRAFCKRLRIPKDLRNLAVLVALYHGQSHSAQELEPPAILTLLKNLDAFRRPDRFAQFLLACEADSKGREGFEQSLYPQATYLRACFEQARAITSERITDKVLNGKELGEAIDTKRVQAITTFFHKS
ncbi:CCA tRNA nucleotidyltransferase, partial [hydrothermal vent metagenome]